eukprot:1127942-Prymnesium_polylepis.1
MVAYSFERADTRPASAHKKRHAPPASLSREPTEERSSRVPYSLMESRATCNCKRCASSAPGTE